MLFYPSHLPHDQLQQNINDGDNYCDKEREESDIVIIGWLLRFSLKRCGGGRQLRIILPLDLVECIEREETGHYQCQCSKEDCCNFNTPCSLCHIHVFPKDIRWLRRSVKIKIAFVIRPATQTEELLEIFDQAVLLWILYQFLLRLLSF